YTVGLLEQEPKLDENKTVIEVVKEAVTPIVDMLARFDEVNARFAEPDADLIIQRVLEFGTWEEIRWLFKTYRSKRIRLFLRRHGERWLKPVAFNYWRRLPGVQRWRKSPFPTVKGELWDH
ncbi:MAG TPA: hypothetical protein VJ785_03905, partial [Anaerolineales bacterium]|nr:hypothetical protein [Anaerolineales bacterium]